MMNSQTVVHVWRNSILWMLHKPFLESKISYNAMVPKHNKIYIQQSTYINCPPWENPNALYPFFNSGSLANWLQTYSTCLFAFRKKPFSISWNTNRKTADVHVIIVRLYNAIIFITIIFIQLLSTYHIGGLYIHYEKMP